MNENLKDTNKENDSVEIKSYDIELNSLQNSNMFFTNTNAYNSDISMDVLRHYIKYPMIYNAVLRQISRQAYSSSGLYGQFIDRMCALPTLSYITTLRNKTQEMKKIKKKFNTVLKLLNIQRTTRDVLRSLLIEGMYVGILRNTTANNPNNNIDTTAIALLDRLEGLSFDDNFMIQPLDLDYCKIIGIQNNICIAAFDMQYFDQFKNNGLINEIKNFPTEFKTGYLQYRKDASKRWMTLDYNKTIALKAKSGELDAYGMPFGISALADIKMNDEYADSQYYLIKELASSIYYLVLPEGEKKGQCSLNKKQQENVIESFENAVKLNTTGTSSKISTLSLAPGTEIDRLSKDSSLLKDTLSEENITKISTNLGVAASALNGVSDSSNLGTLQINLDLLSAQIFQYVDEIAKEMTRIINEHLNILPSNYIDIKFLPITWLNQKDVYEKAKDLYMTTGGSRKYYIAAAGFNPEDYLNVCDEEIEDKLDEKYPPHITSYTASDSADKSNPEGNLGGRETKDVNELTDAGLKTRDLKSNEQRVEDKK